jgi:hypothetical protein
MNCPIWEKSPSRWLQAKEVENPIMGEAMVSCGEVVDIVVAGIVDAGLETAK